MQVLIYMGCIFISAEKKSCDVLGLADPLLVLSTSVLHCQTKRKLKSVWLFLGKV